MSLVLSGKNLIKIPNVSRADITKRLFLSNNPLSSLVGIKKFSNLEVLVIDGTPIDSFLGCKGAPHIVKLCAKDTPISTFDYFHFMSCCVFGDHLKFVDGKPIMESIKIKSRKISQYVNEYLFNGWIILCISPLTIFHQQLDEKRVIEIPKTHKPIKMSVIDKSIQELRLLVNTMNKHKDSVSEDGMSELYSYTEEEAPAKAFRPFSISSDPNYQLKIAETLALLETPISISEEIIEEQTPDKPEIPSVTIIECPPIPKSFELYRSNESFSIESSSGFDFDLDNLTSKMSMTISTSSLFNEDDSV